MSGGEWSGWGLVWVGLEWVGTRVGGDWSGWGLEWMGTRLGGECYRPMYVRTYID